MAKITSLPVHALSTFIALVLLYTALLSDISVLMGVKTLLSLAANMCLATLL